MSGLYVDTSALAKWYLNEARSDEVEAFLRAEAPVAISTLTIVEVRSLLARRRRDRELTPKLEMRVFATFEEDVRHGHLVRHAVDDGMVQSAVNLLAVVPDASLRTLDALHLAIAQAIAADRLATADRVMAGAAKALGFEVVRFD